MSKFLKIEAIAFSHDAYGDHRGLPAADTAHFANIKAAEHKSRDRKKLSRKHRSAPRKKIGK